ncbi:MAG TPA: hypothetical protein VNC60_05225, partial [Actinomycetota bacterium]|nr:hypothetical protein [Actinomycetota bacterium]
MRKSIAALAAALALSLVGGSALAHETRLRLFTDGTGAEIGWTRGPDSPNDGNSSALNIRTDPPTGSEYAYAYRPNFGLGAPGGSSVSGTNVRNLSFDFLNLAGGGYVGAGAPRLSVEIDEVGDDLAAEDADPNLQEFAFLSAFYCQGPTSDPNWSRADFTGATETKGDCTLQYKGVDYSNTATKDAWDVFVAAN